MKLFELHRDVDETGVSGTGVVAQGVIFDSGQCAMTWLTARSSCAVYASIDDVIAIHGHDDKTRVVQVAHYDAPTVNTLRTHALQDDYENIGVDFDKPNHRYVWNERLKLADLFATKDLIE